MAARVNKKFVIILAAGLLVAFGAVAGVAYTVLYKSAAEFDRMGDARAESARAMAERGERENASNEWKIASQFYARAVSRDQANLTYLRKWRDALRQTAPNSPVVLGELTRELRLALRQLALVDTTEIAAQTDYLDDLWRSLNAPGINPPRGEWDYVVSETRTILDRLAAVGRSGSETDKIRKYRGMALVRVMILSPDLPQKDVDLALEDLNTALAAIPGDGEVLSAIDAWYTLRTIRARQAGDLDAAAKFMSDGDAAIAAFVSANPDNILGHLVSLGRTVSNFQQEAATERDREKVIQRVAALQQESIERLDRVRSLYKAMEGKPEAANHAGEPLQRLRRLEEILDPRGRLVRSEEASRIVLAARPNDPDLMAYRAEVLSTRNEYAQAVEQLGQIVALPPQPLGLTAARVLGLRNGALFLQAFWQVRAWQQAPEAEKAGALARARELREALAKVEAPDSAPLSLVDAQLAFVDGQNERANRLLAEYNRRTNNSNADAQWLSAQVALRLNQTGLARERLEQLLRLQPGNVNAAKLLAEIEAGLQNFDRAASLYQAVLEVTPNDELVRQRLNLLQTRRGEAQTTDPIANALLTADRLAGGATGTEEGAREAKQILRDALAPNNHDPRLVQGLVMLLMRDGERDEARAVVDAALAKNPDSEPLQVMKRALETTDPFEAQLAAINASGASELDKTLGRILLFQSANRDDDARRELGRALELGPNDARVLELQFMDLLETQKFDEAQVIADRAARDDLDNARGQTFRARVQAARGDVRSAITTMETVTQAGGANPESWRLLGRLYVLNNQMPDAARAFESALRLRPSDVETIRDLMSAHRASGRDEQALAVARESQRFAAGNASFLEMWLQLEGLIGDKSFAINRRERLYRLQPENRSNAVQLANLLLDVDRRPEARPIIDRVRSTADGIDAVFLDARWYWASDEEERAISVIDAFIASQPEGPRRGTALIAKANFMGERARLDEAVSALDAARPFQDPKVLEVDRALVQLLATAGRTDGVVDACRRIIAAGVDTPDSIYRKQLVDALIRTGKFDDADREIAPLLAGENADVTSLLLQARIRAGRNDRAGERQILDSAVRRFPNDAMVFMARGEALLSDRERLRDAIEDFNRAVQLKPDLWQALRLRAAARISLGEIDQAIDDLRNAVTINPSNDELAVGLIADLLRLGRATQAGQVADQILTRRPNDVALMLQYGALFDNAREFSTGRRYYRQAFERDKQEGVALRYVTNLLVGRDANPGEAESVLRSLGERVNTSPGLLMQYAKLRNMQNRSGDAARFAAQAVRLLRSEDSTLMQQWFTDMRRLIPETDRLLEFINTTEDLGIAPEWMSFFRAELNLAGRTDQAKAAGEAELARLLESAQIPGVRLLAFRRAGVQRYSEEKFEEAAQIWARGLEAFPDDAEILNNLAFTYAKRLNRPAEAVPLAERAAQALLTAEVLDTLGLAYLMNNQPDRAVTALERAALVQAEPAIAVTVLVHLAQAYLATNDREAAVRAISRAEELLQTSPTEAVPDTTRAEVRSMREKVDAPPAR